MKPDKELPSVTTNLLTLSRTEDVAVWFGHSSLFIQIDGIRFLIDPVLGTSASPVKAFNKAFPGSYGYTPADIPEIDYLIITHDHWDYLDYPTVMELKFRIGKVVCPLGVGEHFEYWEFNPHQIFEMDWNEEEELEEGFRIYCLPSRHFSGRGLTGNQSLWASFLLQTPSINIYIGGDGGYDPRFAEIGKRFKNIDLAILETE
ncbi:MAG: MBL fold metallo-hydrolase [Bacteroides sp.]|nr:MBL fold metallo-hydrolase [Bacteroides sp.]